MEKDRENTIIPENAGNNHDIRDEKGRFVKGISGNPAGKPKGTESFSTKFYKVIDKLAKQNNLTPDEIEEQLILVGYKKAKEGDYQFYKDLHDRIHGKAPATIDVTTKGESINASTKAQEIAQKYEEELKETL